MTVCTITVARGARKTRTAGEMAILPSESPGVRYVPQMSVAIYLVRILKWPAVTRRVVALVGERGVRECRVDKKLCGCTWWNVYAREILLVYCQNPELRSQILIHACKREINLSFKVNRKLSCVENKLKRGKWCKRRLGKRRKFIFISLYMRNSQFDITAEYCGARVSSENKHRFTP